MYKFYVWCFVLLMISRSGYAAQQKTTVVAPMVPGVSLESEGSLYWLHFAANVDSLWPMLKNFWAHEGIALKKVNPELGYMETKWITQGQKNPLLAALLSDQAPNRRERFRLRVERLPEADGTRVFIYHSAYGLLLNGDAVYTGYLPPSPQLEIEMLQRLALYSSHYATSATASAGTPSVKPQATNPQVITHPVTLPLASYHIEHLQAKVLSQHQYGIEVPGSVALVQKKLVRALDRMNINVVSKTEDTLLVKITPATQLNPNKDTTDWEIDEDSDLEAPPRPDTFTARDNIRYWLVLVKKPASVIISIRGHEDNTDNGKGLAKFSRMLAKNL